MSRFDDLKDTMVEGFWSVWDKFQESSVFILIRERYENLGQRQQKMLFVSAFTVVGLVIAAIPYMYFLSSTDSMDEFKTKRRLMQELIKVSLMDSSSIPEAPAAEQLKGQIESILTAARVLPEQQKGVEILTESSSLIPPQLYQNAIKVVLGQLNLEQIIEVGHRLATMHDVVKLKDMQVTATKDAKGYFDVIYVLARLGMEKSATESTEQEQPQRRSRRK